MGAPVGKIVVVLGTRADGTLRTLELTDADLLKVALSSPDLSGLMAELQQKLETADLELTAKILSVGDHGWVGGALQKQPIIIGYSGDLSAQFNDTAPAVGYDVFSSDPIGPGEIATVQAIHCRNITSAGTAIVISCTVNLKQIFLAEGSGLAQFATVRWQGTLTLSEGDTITIDYSGATEGDTIDAVYHAIITDIDQ